MNLEPHVMADTYNSVRSAKLISMVERLKEEHLVLNETVSVLYSKAVEYTENHNILKWRLIPHLRHEVLALMRELDDHAEWEEKELFPTLMTYTNLHNGPSIIPSIWVLEKEHDLAKQFIQPFLNICVKIFFEENAAILLDLQIQAQINSAVTDLRQACIILQEHFRMEEDLIKTSCCL